MNYITQTASRPAPQHPALRLRRRLILLSIGAILALLFSGAVIGELGGILNLLGNFVHLNLDTSPNWSGYTFPKNNVTGVRAAWIEPVLSDLSANASVSVWVGIGGTYESRNNLIQMGTDAYASDGHVLDAVWYETLPGNHLVTMGTLSPKDHVFASIELKQGSNQMWNLSLVDVTKGRQFSAEVSFSSMHMYADFIAEDPSATLKDGSPYAPFAHFTSIPFNTVTVRYGGNWITPDASQGIQIKLVQSERTLARPGPLRNDAFTIQRV